MFETLPEQDCLFPDFIQKCANYVNFEIATKQRNLIANIMLGQLYPGWATLPSLGNFTQPLLP